MVKIKKEIIIINKSKQPKTSVNISGGAAAVAAAVQMPLKDKSYTCPAHTNGWNNGIFIVANYYGHLHKGRKLPSGAVPVNACTRRN